MGSKFNFACPSCGYSTMVSGQRDVGMVAVVQTMVCEDCQELVDVLIGCYGQDGPMGDPDFDKDLDLCPECEGQKVTPWASQHSCPKCGVGMIREDSPVLMWD
jgi:predicted RNA-binding Zn-ribbon protein involved in translation (DUF1610 family)